MRRLITGFIAAIVVALAGPTAAQTEDAEPTSAQPPWFGGRAELSEHGFAMAVPDGAVAYDMTGDLESQLRVVVPEASEEDVTAWAQIMRERMRGQLVLALTGSSCGFVVGPTIGADLDSVADEFHDRQSADGSVVHVESPRVVELPAAEARLVTYGRAGEDAALYFGERDGMVFDIWCAGAERPEDDWLSIAAAFEWLPVPLQRAATPRQGASFEVPAAWDVMTDLDFLPESPLSPSSELRPTDWLMTREAQTGEVCSLFVYAPETTARVSLDAEMAGLLAFYGSDPGKDVVTPTPEPISLPAGDALRIRVVSDEGRPPDGITYLDLYVLAREGDLVKVQCAGELPHQARWLAFAETLDLPPEEES